MEEFSMKFLKLIMVFGVMGTVVLQGMNHNQPQNLSVRRPMRERIFAAQQRSSQELKRIQAMQKEAAQKEQQACAQALILLGAQLPGSEFQLDQTNGQGFPNGIKKLISDYVGALEGAQLRSDCDYNNRTCSLSFGNNLDDKLNAFHELIITGESAIQVEPLKEGYSCRTLKTPYSHYGHAQAVGFDNGVVIGYHRHKGLNGLDIWDKKGNFFPQSLGICPQVHGIQACGDNVLVKTETECHKFEVNIGQKRIQVIALGLGDRGTIHGALDDKNELHIIYQGHTSQGTKTLYFSPEWIKEQRNPQNIGLRLDVHCVNFDSANNLLLIAYDPKNKQQLQLVDLQGNVKQIINLEYPIFSDGSLRKSCQPAGKNRIAVHHQNGMNIIDLTTGKSLNSIAGQFKCIAVNKEATLAAAADSNDRTSVWDIKPDETVLSLIDKAGKQ